MIFHVIVLFPMVYSAVILKSILLNYMHGPRQLLKTIAITATVSSNSRYLFSVCFPRTQLSIPTFTIMQRRKNNTASEKKGMMSSSASSDETSQAHQTSRSPDGAPRSIRGIYFGEYQQPAHEEWIQEESTTSFPFSLLTPYNKHKNHVLVRVHAVSVNPVDAKGVIGDKLSVHWTQTRKFMHNRLVKNTRVGFDFVGKVIENPIFVDSVDNDATNNNNFPVGTMVYGTMPPLKGSFAEYIWAPMHQIACAPSSIREEEIASLPLVGLTAWQALSPYIVAGQSSVLIIGGSGGAGHIAIQVAKALGAKSIVTVCSTRNIDFVKQCGASHVVDYTNEDVVSALQNMTKPSPENTTKDGPANAQEYTDVGQFDVILDCVTSGDPDDEKYDYPQKIRNAQNPAIVTPHHLYQCLGGCWIDWIRAGLARPGIFPHSWLWKDPQLRLFWIKFPHSADALIELTKLVERGKLKPHLQKVYPEMTADTVQQAMDDLMSRRVQGKIAIRVIDQESTNAVAQS